MKINLFIVGAPKSGTTALFKYLGMHPDIFIPDFLYGNTGKREANHFALEYLQESSPFRDRFNYLSYFSKAKPNQTLVDASVYHLFSETAPRGIHAYNPDAKIIIMLRNPVDFIASYFQEMCFIGVENISNLEQALQAESARKMGRLLPKIEGLNPDMLCYQKLATFTPYVNQYLQIFGRKNVMFIKFDDFIQDTREVYNNVLDFIGVHDWCPEVFAKVNPAKQIRFHWLRKVRRKPPVWLTKPLKPLMPQQARRALRRKMHRLEQSINTKNTKSMIDLVLANKLRGVFNEEVRNLAILTQLDLHDWL